MKEPHPPNNIDMILDEYLNMNILYFHTGIDENYKINSGSKTEETKSIFSKVQELKSIKDSDIAKVMDEVLHIQNQFESKI